MSSEKDVAVDKSAATSAKKNKQSGKMTEEEKKQWDSLYRYFKRDIMEYTEEMNLSSYCVISLMGAAQGLVVAKNLAEHPITYGYDTVLMTLILHKNDIKRSIKNKNFSSESAKINYIMKIVNNHINDVYLNHKYSKTVAKQQAVLSEKIFIENENSQNLDTSKTDSGDSFALEAKSVSDEFHDAEEKRKQDRANRRKTHYSDMW